MKGEKFFTAVIALGLAIAVAAAGIGCVLTGFELRVADMTRIMGTILLCIGIYALLAQFRGGGLVFAALGLLTVSILVRRGTLLLSVESLLYQISTVYDRGYGWGYIRWSQESLRFVTLDGALTFFGCLIALAVCFCVLRRKWLPVGLLAGLLPLFVSCVVTDTVPDPGWLWLLLTALLLLGLTHLARRGSAADGNRITALLLVPVLLFSGVLFRNAPLGEYPVQSQEAREALMALTEKLSQLFSPQGQPTGPGDVPQIPDYVDLSNTGPLKHTGKKVMEITTPVQMSHFYLRGRSYDTYTGTGWESVLDTFSEGGWPYAGLVTSGKVTVRTEEKLDILYFPYYVEDDGWTGSLRDGSLENPEGLKEYSFTMMQDVVWSGIMMVPSWTPLSNREQQAYLALPEDTAAEAREILSSIFGNEGLPTDKETDLGASLSTAMKAYQISNYVREHAIYDEATPSMPEGEKDFAIWFLTKADRGYCVHFATAATVLLRAAGIPARYVTGYLAEANGGTTRVTDEQAHAWVEYLHPTRGWTVLEATPGEDVVEPTETTQPSETTEPTETTQPSETTEPTEITQPSENTEPTETTLPSETTAPTETTLPPSASGQTEQTDPGVLPGPGGSGGEINLAWIRAILWILAAWAVLVGQDRLRKYLRRRKLTSGDANRQALARWKYAKQLSRLSGYSAAPLLPLAEKAAFSQHLLSREELAEFDAWFRQAKQALREKGWIRDHLIRWLFAIE